MTETKLNLAQKLVRVYDEIESVAKRGTNSAQNYKYVKAADLAHAVRNALQKLNVYAQAVFSDVRPWSFVTSTGKSQNSFDVTCTLTFIDADDPTATRYIATGIGSGADFGDKGVFKAQTGALKYALRNAFLVPDETDPENDEHDTASAYKAEAAAQSDAKKTSGHTSGHAQIKTKPVNVPEDKFASANRGSGPEKAQIPNDLGRGTATVTTSTETSASSAPSTASDANELPNDTELGAFRKQHVALVKLLSENGLTSETGNPQKKKVLTYLLQTTGVDAAENITKGQWRTFFEVTAATNPKELVALVEAAGK